MAGLDVCLALFRDKQMTLVLQLSVEEGLNSRKQKLNMVSIQKCLLAKKLKDSREFHCL